jgi:FAD/FMN-containing dehydrogenase
MVSDMTRDPSAKEQMIALWQHCLEDKLALVCFREDSSYVEGMCPEIVGLNVTSLGRIEEKGHRPEVQIFDLIERK